MQNAFRNRSERDARDISGFTKGVGKNTVPANLGGLLADAGLRVLLLELDGQPSHPSHYSLSQKAHADAYELIALNLTIPELVISRTYCRHSVFRSSR